ncbi:hypothetical protein [Rhodanobacter lindaniclasticus]
MIFIGSRLRRGPGATGGASLAVFTAIAGAVEAASAAGRGRLGGTTRVCFLCNCAMLASHAGGA